MMQTNVCLAVVLLLTFVFGDTFAAPVTNYECPPNKPQVECFANPCDVSSCPDDPTATCSPDYCGGCYAIWRRYDGSLANCNSKCPPGQGEVQCVRDPCQDQICPMYPDATCVADYCGGCNAEWFKPDGEQVQCDTGS